MIVDLNSETYVPGESAPADGSAAVLGGRSDATRLGRMAASPAGRSARDWLAARGLLWPLVAARQPPIRVAERPAAAERVLAKLGFPGSITERLVTAESDACIDGFPRSANTYAVAGFRGWNRGARVAHHMHAAFQVRRAVRLGVPCCVLVRRPLEAVASTLLMDRQRVSDDSCFRSYIRYHRGIAPLVERIVVCRFEEVVADPSIVVQRLNERFGTSFACQQATGDAEASMLAEIRRRRPGPAPSTEKEPLKGALRARLAHNRLLPEAETAYAAVAGSGPR